MVAKTQDKEVNLAELTDEEIMNLDVSGLPEKEEEEEKEEKEENASEPGTDQAEDQSTVDEDDEEDDTEEPDGADSEDDPDEDDEGVDTDSAEEDDDDDTEEADPDAGEEQDDEADQASDDSTSEEGETDDSTDEVDYKAELAKVMAPFKAAGREVKVNTPEDVRRLMQMGVDYSRKMADMKPYQKVLKTLERNDLLDIEKINFLIDLDQKDPEAIKKFLKDSKIDPMELNLEDDSTYRPNDHAVGDKELAVDSVIDSIRGTDSFDRTVDIITNTWDTDSKRLLLDNPNVISMINDHVSAGLYDQINDRLNSERLVGKHAGLSDLVAYHAVGDAMHAEGAFTAPTPTATLPQKGQTQDSQDLNGSDDSEADIKRKNRRKAASPTKGKAATRKKAPNFAKFTDEQIEKFDINSL